MCFQLINTDAEAPIKYMTSPRRNCLWNSFSHNQFISSFLTEALKPINMDHKCNDLLGIFLFCHQRLYALFVTNWCVFLCIVQNKFFFYATWIICTQRLCMCKFEHFNAFHFYFWFLRTSNMNLQFVIHICEWIRFCINVVKPLT